MNILFITHPYPNYVPDLLLHGLRKIMGPMVVDYPRKTCVYEGVLGLGICPDDQRCPGWFPNDSGLIDRTDIWPKVEKGYFDLVVCDIRALPKMSEQLNAWPKQCVLIDGEDYPHIIPPGPYIVCRRETDGSDYSIPLPMALPEEILSWIARYSDQPKRFSIGFLGSTQNDHRRSITEALSQHYTDTLFQTTEIPSDETPVPKGRLSRDGFYKQLQQCKMVLSLAGAGWDTFRFWENTAFNAVHLANHLPLYIPNDFEDGKDIVRFVTLDELRRKIDALLVDRHKYSDHIACRQTKLLKYHLTTHRAADFLDRVRIAFGK